MSRMSARKQTQVQPRQQIQMQAQRYRQKSCPRERNFRCKFGEVDLIAEKDGYLVFVEVKYRSTARYGMPSEAVDARKQRRICNVASFYLYRNHLPADTPVRFDVAAVSEQSMEMIENAFPYCGRFG